MRDAKGLDVGGKAQLMFENAKPHIDKWGEAVQQMIIRRLTSPGR